MTPAEMRALMVELGYDSQATSREEAPSDPRSTNSLYSKCNGDGPVSLFTFTQMTRKSIKFQHFKNNHFGNDLLGPRVYAGSKRPYQLELIPAQNVSIQPRADAVIA
jgi:hypothetical protein